MLSLPEWLQLVGLQGRNPFANKQADEEREWLEAVFVEHPAYDAIAREVEPRSSILYADRGAGKTTTCAMFERLCFEEAERRRPLVVRFQEWIPLVDLREQPLHTQVNRYLEALFCHTVAALLEIADAPWIGSPSDPFLQAYLTWFCTHYADRLTDQELRGLTGASRVLPRPVESGEVARRLGQLPPTQQLRWLLRALQAAGVRTVYVLLDRVDEVATTVAQPERGADLVLPFLGNLELLELPGLVFKCFVPGPIVDVLRARGQLREDRIGCYALTWSDVQGVTLLRKLLQNRLSYFSNGIVPSLAALSDASLRDIDDVISRAAAGSPRRLLILAERLLLERARDASVNDLLIQPRHLQSVVAPAATPAEPEPPSPPAPPSAPVATRDAHRVPLLTLGADGCVARGGVPIPGWQQLPTRQREVLEYLFQRPDERCTYTDLGRDVWRDESTSDDTVRKVVERLRRFLHEGLKEERYLERVTGGYILRHAAREHR